jgi:putative ABC transport system permease protein
MTLLSRIKSMLRWVIFRHDAERELADDIQSFIDLSAAEKERSGVPPDAARRMAILEVGGAEQAKERVRRYRHGGLLHEIGRDFRHALRIFGRSPGFTFIVIGTLALGIGANAAIFSLMDAVMFRSLPVRNPQNLVEVRLGAQRQAFSYPVWEQIRDHQKFFESMVAYGFSDFNLAPSGETHMVRGLYVSGTYFDVLGIHPAFGRLLTPDDDRRGCSKTGPAAVLSYDFWQSQYGGALNVIGRPISLSGRSFTILGVSSPDFWGVRVGQSFDVAVPACSRSDLVDFADASWLRFLGRLKAGESITEAESGLRTLQPAVREATLSPQWSESRTRNYFKEPFRLVAAAGGSSPLRDQYSMSLMVLMGVVGIVLLIACGNIASLLLARASARTREIAVRVSLGASRFRLIRQLLVESVVLSLAGSIAGIFIARVSSRFLANQLSTSRGRIFLDLSLDWRVVAFTVAVGILTGLIFGIVPALRSTQWTPAESLRETSVNSTASRSSAGAGRWLVSFQIALSLVLVFGAALFLRSYWTLATTDHGFRATNVELVSASLPGPATEAKAAAFAEAFDEIRALHGVQSAAYSVTVPLGDSQIDNHIRAGSPFQEDQDGDAYLNYVSPGYFATLETSLLSGRDFDASDSPTPDRVAIVNETFARQFFGGNNPVGKTFQRRRPDDTWMAVEIVGFVKDASYSTLRESVPPTAFLPIRHGMGGYVFSIRTSLDAKAITPDIVNTFSGINKNFSLSIDTLQTRVGDSLVQERMLALLSIFFGGLALIIAAIGLAGLVSFSVSRRRAEIGIRAALGASPASLVRLMMRDVISLTAFGLLFGSISGSLTARLVASMLYQISTHDPKAVGIAIATLLLVALAAGYVPARRAAHVDPVTCLRSE